MKNCDMCNVCAWFCSVVVCRANDINRYDCEIGRTGIRSLGTGSHSSFIILIK